MHALAVQSGLSLFSSTHCLSRVIQPAITPWLLQFLHDRTLGLRTAGRSPRAASSSPLAQPTEACGLVIAIWGLSWRVQPLVTRLAKQPIPTAMDLGRMFISTCSSAQFGRSQLGFWGSLTVVVQPAGNHQNCCVCGTMRIQFRSQGATCVPEMEGEVANRIKEKFPGSGLF